MAIIGISCYYHDAAAACVSKDGSILAAAHEERFSRIRHDASFPRDAFEYCVGETMAAGEIIEKVVFYENPLLKFDRIAQSALRLAPDNREEFEDGMSSWLGGRLFQVSDLSADVRRCIPDFDCDTNLLFVEHHLSHAASAFYPSPFEEAAILTLDGVGEHATASLSLGNSDGISMIKEMRYPNSLGLLYSAFTHFTGFKINSGEYKMMGLAPYGAPVYEKKIRDKLVSVGKDGSFLINDDVFQGFSRNDVIAEKLESLLGLARRSSDDPLASEYADVAASIQRVVEDIVTRLSRTALSELGVPSLCLAGGVALNSVANGRLAREIGERNLWIQPAAGDAGGALGAALHVWNTSKQDTRRTQRHGDTMSGAYLGPKFDTEDIGRRLKAMGADFIELPMSELTETVARRLADGKSVAWFQGRMEYGPRALGNRSILADPRRPETQKKLNLQVKKRESFRPFAPAVLEEFAKDWFELEASSPYMLLVSQVRDEHLVRMGTEDGGMASDGGVQPMTDHSAIPAVTHVDYSARVQTVSADTNPLFHSLVEAFHQITGCPILVNTSFNVRGEPIVCTPEDAFRCFVNTDLDYLAIGPYLVDKAEQDPLVCMRFFQAFEED